METLEEDRQHAKAQCVNTMEVNAERILHFIDRMNVRGDDPNEVLIVVINVDSSPGATYIANALMPGHNWQMYRDRGETPFARGLAGREGLQELLDAQDPEEGAKLREAAGRHVALVFDHGTARTFVLKDRELN